MAIHPYAEMQLVDSTAPANWATKETERNFIVLLSNLNQKVVSYTVWLILIQRKKYESPFKIK